MEKLNDSEDIHRAWENIQENFKTQFKEILGPYEFKQQNHGLMKNVYFFRLKITFACSDYSIQTIAMYTNQTM